MQRGVSGPGHRNLDGLKPDLTGLVNAGITTSFSSARLCNRRRGREGVVMRAAGRVYVPERGCGDGRSISDGSYLVDPASSHMLVSKIKPCMSKYNIIL